MWGQKMWELHIRELDKWGLDKGGPANKGPDKWEHCTKQTLNILTKNEHLKSAAMFFY